MKNVRNYWIDFWKVVFAIMIVICHSAVLPTAVLAETIAPLSYLGVEFFFIVSGFLMVKSAVRDNEKLGMQTIGRDTLSFIARKIKSFLPYYLFAFVLSVTLTTVIGEYTQEQITDDLTTFVWDILFLRLSGLRGYSVASAVGGTWYLSAMLIAMFIMYPIARKWSDLYANWIAPVVAILLIGWICNRFGKLNLAIEWTEDGFLALGLIRAIGEICLGAWCYALCERLSKCNFTHIGTTLLSIIEIGCYVCILLVMFHLKNGYYSFLIFPLYVIAITLSFSNKTYWVKLFRFKAFSNLGVFSLCLYLNHYVWQKLLKILAPALSFEREFWLYFVLAIATAFTCMYAIMGLKWLWNKYGYKVKGLFILKNSQPILEPSADPVGEIENIEPPNTGSTDRRIL